MEIKTEKVQIFKEGDKVVCINFYHNSIIHDIVSNKVLTVTGYTELSSQLTFKETPFTFNQFRFRLATLLEKELAEC